MEKTFVLTISIVLAFVVSIVTGTILVGAKSTTSPNGAAGIQPLPTLYQMQQLLLQQQQLLLQQQQLLLQQQQLLLQNIIPSNQTLQPILPITPPPPSNQNASQPILPITPPPPSNQSASQPILPITPP